MVFSDPRWLLGLLALPVLLLLEWLAARRSRASLERLVGSRIEGALLSQRIPSERVIGAALRLGAVAMLVIGAAGPEWGREVVRRGATGSDVVMAIDVSASMDARDVAPNRLAEARREALGVLERIGGSRVGVVAFAGDATRVCPLTLDRGTARLIIESLSSTSVSQQGSDLGRGLRMALRTLPTGRREEQVIVLWTDGEDTDAGARAAVEELARAGVRVLAVGVGTPAGDIVPVLDSEGHATDVKREADGTIHRSSLDEPLLRSLARRTGGAYFSGSRPGGELPRLLSALGTVARSGKGERLVERPVSRFPLLAAAASVLLLVDRARARRRPERKTARTLLHSERGAPAALVALLLLLPVPARAQSPWARGNKAFKAGHYADAESLYTQRLKRGGPAAVRLNRATARALSGRGEEAEAELRPLTERDDATGRESRYNLGTLLGQRQEYDPALATLRRTLERNPVDEDARWNYEVLMRRKSEEQRSQRPKERPQPSPSAAGGGGGGGSSGAANPPPSPQGGSGSPPPAQPPPAGGGAMSRTQAEQLLSALQELARADQQRQRKVTVMRERQGKDW